MSSPIGLSSSNMEAMAKFKRSSTIVDFDKKKMDFIELTSSDTFRTHRYKENEFSKMHNIKK